MTGNNNKITKKLYAGLLVLVGFVLLAMNLSAGMKADDYEAIHNFARPDRLATLGTLWESTVAYYNNVCGRVANQLLQFFLCLPQGRLLFAVVNTLVGVALVHALSRLLSSRQPSRTGQASSLQGGGSGLLSLCMAIAVTAVWLPAPGETMVWMSGATVYLWGSTAMLWLMILLSSPQPRTARPRPGHTGGGVCRVILCTLLIAFAATFCEANSLPVFLGLLIAWVASPRRPGQGQALHSPVGEVVPAMLGLFLGLLMVLLSPGGWSRLESGDSITVTGGVWHVIAVHITNVWHAAGWTLLAALVVTGIHAWVNRRIELTHTVLIGAVASSLLFGVPQERTYFLPVAVASVVILSPVVRLLERQAARNVLPVTCCLLLAVAGVAMAEGLYVGWKHWQWESAQLAAVKAAPREAVLPAAWFSHSSRWVKPERHDSESYVSFNRFYASLYGKDNVQWVREELLKRYDAGTLLAQSTKFEVQSAKYKVQSARCDVKTVFEMNDAERHLLVPVRRDDVRGVVGKVVMRDSVGNVLLTRTYFNLRCDSLGCDVAVLPPLVPGAKTIEMNLTDKRILRWTRE